MNSITPNPSTSQEPRIYKRQWVYLSSTQGGIYRRRAVVMGEWAATINWDSWGDVSINHIPTGMRIFKHCPSIKFAIFMMAWFQNLPKLSDYVQYSNGEATIKPGYNDAMRQYEAVINQCGFPLKFHGIKGDDSHIENESANGGLS